MNIISRIKDRVCGKDISGLQGNGIADYYNYNLIEKMR